MGIWLPIFLKHSRALDLLVPRLFMGLLLLIAAGLKAWPHLIRHQPIPMGEGHLVWVIVIGELCLGFWLLSGRVAPVAVRISLLVFGGFALVNLWKILHGYESCGCFGAVEVSPSISYGIDAVAIFSCLLTVGNDWRSPCPVILRSAIGRIATVFILMLSLWMAGASLTKYISDNPLQWVGRTWSKPGDLEVIADLSEGRWVVMFYHAACHRCRTAAEDLDDQAQIWRSHGKNIGVALIDTGNDANDLSHSPDVVGGSFKAPQSFGSPPIILIVDGGRIQVAVAYHGGIDWDAPPFLGWVQ